MSLFFLRSSLVPLLEDVTAGSGSIVLRASGETDRSIAASAASYLNTDVVIQAGFASHAHVSLGAGSAQAVVLAVLLALFVACCESWCKLCSVSVNVVRSLRAMVLRNSDRGQRAGGDGSGVGQR